MATVQARDSPTAQDTPKMNISQIRDIVTALHHFRVRNVSLAASQRDDDAQSEELTALKVR